MSRLLRQSERGGAGFTLIELMIVVAIIGILAAIAIPNFLKFQLRSRVSEGKLNLAGIRTAQESYYAEVGTFVPWALAPGGVPSQLKRPWPGGCSFPPVPADPGYCLVGWRPEGDVFYNYIAATVPGPLLASQELFAVAESDIETILDRFKEGVERSSLGPKIEINTSSGSPDDTLAELVEALQPHLTDLDRERIEAHGS